MQLRLLKVGLTVLLASALVCCAPSSPMEGTVNALSAIESQRQTSVRSDLPPQQWTVPAPFRVADVSWCGDSRTLVSSSASDKAVLLWDGYQAQVQSVLERAAGSRTLACSTDARRVAAGQDSNKLDSDTVRVWDVSAPGAFRELRGPFPPHEGRNVNLARSMFFSPDGSRLLVHWRTAFVPGHTPIQQRLVVYDTAKWTPVLEVALQPISSVYLRIAPAISPDGTRYAYAHGVTERLVSIIVIATGAETRRLPSPPKFQLLAVAFGPEAKTVFMAGSVLTGYIPAPQLVQEYDLSSNKLLRSIRTGHVWDINTTAYSRQSDLLITAADDKTVEVRRGSSGELVATLGDKAGILYAIAVRPDGQQVVSAASNVINAWTLPPHSRAGDR